MKVNEVNESNNTTENISETKSWFFEKINKIDKPLSSLIQKKKKKRKRSNYN